jgi:hypothetical protein
MTGDINQEWMKKILDRQEQGKAWADIFSSLLSLSLKVASPVALHEATIVPDRLLAEAAWELWEAYIDQADRTSDTLKQWTNSGASQGTGKAVLIIDALSLREMPYILEAAKVRGITPALVKATGAECPSTTDQFAKSLGVASRAALAHDKKPQSFALLSESCFTDVLNLPFEDCPVPPAPNIVFWHSWLDDLLHVQKKSPDVVSKAASDIFQGDGFWHFVNKLRQGRNIVITSDHGYAVSKLFSSEISDPDAVDALRDVFGASRCKEFSGAWQKNFMPPLVLNRNGHHVVMGQWKWKAPGGFPHVCHGGLSLLEVAVPWMEFSALS